jgi:glyoxylase-like metal-dependent hydrolase (beta-lactamase superfamily II)
LIPFVRDLEFTHGVADRLSPNILRVIAPNPGPFTFTGSGTYLVGDAAGVAVIDPGPDLPAHRAAILKATPGPIDKILVTHTHLDHSGGARSLQAETSAEILGMAPHPTSPEAAAPALEEGADFAFVPDRTLRDGETVAIGELTLEAVHTPGHIGNHLCFSLIEEETLFTGDHIMGWSTTVVAPPDGDMRHYMESLERLLSRQDRRYLPTHGAPIEHPRPFVEAVKAHRLARDAAILDALATGPKTITEIVRMVYVGLDPALHLAAGLNVKAHLDAHMAEDRVARDGDSYRRTSAR